MKLSIIILNYNTKDLTLESIKGLNEYYGSEINSKEIEIIVVDNSSSDDSIKALEKIKNIRLIKNQANYGFGKGCNIGAKSALGRHLLFLNSDALVKDKGILKMASFLEDHPKIGIVGGKLLNNDGSQQGSCGNFYNLFNLLIVLLAGERIGLVRKKPKETKEVDWVSGASMMVRRDLFEKLKGFDENFFMYMEDMELCFRVRNAGYRVYFFSEVRIVHKEQGSSNRTFAITNIYRGILYFYKKHNLLEYPLVWSMLLFKAVVAIIIGTVINNDYLKKTYSGALKLAV